MGKIKYSVIVPVFNEEEALPKFVEAIVPVMTSLNEPFELIFVNDGSKDKTETILKELAQKDKRVKFISFSRNFGQQAALLCGFKHAEGEAVIDIDVDLQDPVETIPLMIEKWKQGYQVVHGKRKKRKGETVFKKLTAFIYARFLRKITGMDIPSDTGDFKLFDRKVVDELVALPEHNRFLRGLTTWVGYKQTSVEFERNKRVAGQTKYTIKKLFRHACNGIIAYSDFPLFLPLYAGMAFGMIGVVSLLVFIILALCKIALPIGAWLFPVLFIVASVIEINKFASNLYLSRIYEEVKGRPNYIIEYTVNINK